MAGNITSLTPAKWIALVLFVLFVFGGGTLIGISIPPGDWYAGLAKPPFNPPNWIFGPVWSVLYLLIAFAGWRVWCRNPAGLPMQVWFAQMALNFLWTPAFFGLQRAGLALVVILAMLLLIIWFIRLNWWRDRISALAFLPYAAWVAFASLLNASIVWLN